MSIVVLEFLKVPPLFKYEVYHFGAPVCDLLFLAWLCAVVGPICGQINPVKVGPIGFVSVMHKYQQQRVLLLPDLDHSCPRRLLILTVIVVAPVAPYLVRRVSVSNP